RDRSTVWSLDGAGGIAGAARLGPVWGCPTTRAAPPFPAAWIFDPEAFPKAALTTTVAEEAAAFAGGFDPATRVNWRTAAEASSAAARASRASAFRPARA